MTLKTTGFNPVSEFKSGWIADGIKEDCIEYLENFGFYLCHKTTPDDRFPGPNALTTSQMRNIFGEIKRIEANLDFPAKERQDDDAETVQNKLKAREKAKGKFEGQKTHILLLRPKLAYNAARQLEKRRDSRIKQFREVLEKALAVVHDQDQYKRFCQFVEGIVAYHKVYGGKDNANR